jgi:hypothetical protein
MTLASTIKGTLMVSEYYSKMKKLVDEMESADKKLDPEKFMSYVLAWCLRLLRVLNLSCPTSCFFRCWAMSSVLRYFKDGMGISPLQTLSCTVVVDKVAEEDVVAATVMVVAVMAPALIATTDLNAISVAR